MVWAWRLNEERSARKMCINIVKTRLKLIVGLRIGTGI